MFLLMLYLLLEEFWENSIWISHGCNEGSLSFNDGNVSPSNWNLWNYYFNEPNIFLLSAFIFGLGFGAAMPL